MKLVISIVYYDSGLATLEKSLKSIVTALDYAATCLVDLSTKVVVVDNGGILSQVKGLVSRVVGDGRHECMVLGTGGNIGYGAAHNLVILNEQSDYHLVINPDVKVLKDAFVNAINYMQQHMTVGLLSPYSEDPEGYKQYLCKRYPAVLDLFLRGFAPRFVKQYFTERLHEYEMPWDLNERAPSKEVIASGSFMFVRYSALYEVKGFSPDFFFYFEDFDLSIRIGKHSNIAYVPEVRIVHAGGNASKKGLKHIIMFAKSAFVFYHKHGWRWA
ncbi:MAG: glycosyltransferase family 2 protein [Candidatus Thiodiazotropha sp. (ex Lucinoma aequizonata)]|nr:glycosyltransferase family 2 protein [Candidatus Thiodiazotropha sp. (ex Lucinoma aequizonata)]MCU7909235.1 glycosyltransferase family 2 protein [Candidatus Thiodiazotropha sp. (ex Lucinoma aequizonata)]MCU7911522.1 glycosyltransferase family 2 protein [Candidatus Thiodiazotropha sp. (ex Lucinoma aequizonata)]